MMSQGLGRPEEKERERRGAGRWSSQNITSLIGGLMDMGHGDPTQL